jgi:signal transduction histidine kinase
MNKTLLILLLILLNGSLYASHRLDSLLLEYQKDNSSEAQYNILDEIINEKLGLMQEDNQEFLDEAIALTIQLDWLYKKAYLNNLYGVYWSQLGDQKLAIEFHFKAIRHFEKNENYKALADCYKNLGETFRASLDYSESIKYLNKAIELFRKAKDTFQLASGLNRLAAVMYEYLPEQVKHQAIDYAMESVELAKLDNNQGLIANNYTIIGAAYRAIGDLDQAEKYLNEAYGIYQNIDDIAGVPVVLTNLVFLHADKKELDSAEYYLEICNEFTAKHNLPSYYYYLYDVIAYAYAENGEFENAYEYRTKSLNFKSKQFDASKRKALLELEAIYKTEKKEQQLEANKQEQFYQIIISIFIIASILGLVFLFYLRNRTMKIKNEFISKQNDALKDLNDTKDKFFSIIAHDIKNPVSSFRNALEVMVSDFEDMDKKESKEFLSLMNDAAGQLYELLENLLTWARSQRGSLQFDPIEVDIAMLVEKSVDYQAVQAADKKIAIESWVKKGLQVRADANMINTVIRNLVSNAIKFTPEHGKIMIKADQFDDRIEVVVEDTGIGMDNKVLEKLFKIDVSHTSLGTNNEQGTGLGLIICKEFIEKHNGRIWAESELNKGTKFIFSLPKN